MRPQPHECSVLNITSRSVWKAWCSSNIALPNPTPEVEEAWAAFDREIVHNVSVDLPYEQEILWTAQQRSDFSRQRPAFAKACELYIAAIRDIDMQAEVAKAVKSLSDRYVWRNQNLATLIRLIATARFRQLWSRKPALTEILMGCSYECSDRTSGAFKIPYEQRHAEEAYSVAGFIGALFAEEIASYCDIQLCISSLRDRLGAYHLRALQLLLVQAGDRFCSLNNKQFVLSLCDDLKGVASRFTANGSSYERLAAENICDMVSDFMELQSEKLARSVSKSRQAASSYSPVKDSKKRGTRHKRHRSNKSDGKSGGSSSSHDSSLLTPIWTSTPLKEDNDHIFVASPLAEYEPMSAVYNQRQPIHAGALASGHGVKEETCLDREFVFPSMTRTSTPVRHAGKLT